ncbi:MFS transporter [Bacillus bombysepticus]
MIRESLWTKNFIFLSMSNFFTFVSFYMLVPTLPIFLLNVLGGKEDQIGLIIGFFTSAQIFSRPLSGKWLDDFGRKKVFLVGRIVFFVLMIFYLNITGLLLFLILRFIHVFSFGVASTAAGTIIADIIPAKRRAEGIGFYSAFTSLALVIGPSIGLLIMDKYDFKILFTSCLFFAGISVILGGLLKIESTSRKEEHIENEKKFSWKKYIEPKAIPISIISILLVSVYGGIVSFIALYAQELGIVSAAGYFFSVYSIAILISRPITGKISDKFGPNLIIYPGMIICIFGIVLLSQATNTTLFLISALMIGLGLGAIQPTLNAMVIESVPSERRGAATATYFMSVDIGIVVGAFIIGTIVKYVGYNGAFLSSSFFVGISLIFYWIYQTRRSKIKERDIDKDSKVSM